MNAQTVAVVLIVAFAAIFVAHRAWRTLVSSKKNAAVGCANCDAASPSADDWAR